MYKTITIFTIGIIVLLSGCTQSFSVDVDSSEKISAIAGNFTASLDDSDQFGLSLANLGDIESDGVIDLAVGAPGDDDNGTDQGAVYILFMDDNGQVDISQKISENDGNFTGVLDDGDRFGTAIATLGDLNNDGFIDIAVGAPGDDDGGTDRGAVWILFLNAQGLVLSHQKLSNDTGNLGFTLDDNDQFGSALTSLGDMNGDGIADLAVGAPGDDDGGTDRGAVWILFMNNNGTVASQQKISSGTGGFTGSLADGDRFGAALTTIGRLAAGAPGADDGGADRGAVWLLQLNANGTVSSERKIAQNNSEFSGPLADGDRFGTALSNLGDLNSDGIDDLGVGASLSDDGGLDRGAVWVLFLRRDDSVLSATKISDTAGNFPGLLNDNDQFGGALVSLDDLDGDGIRDIATTASLDNDGGADRGAVWILFMRRAETRTVTDYDVDLGTVFSGRGY